MELILKYEIENVKTVITYKLNQKEINRIKNAIQRYLDEELDSSHDGPEVRGFWSLALDIEDKIIKGYGLLHEDLYAVEDIYCILKHEIAPKVLKESLKK